MSPTAIVLAILSTAIVLPSCNKTDSETEIDNGPEGEAATEGDADSDSCFAPRWIRS